MNKRTINQERKLKLIRQCIAILDVSANRIEKQGTGCNIPKHGAAYKHEGKLDAIAILVGSACIHNSWFRTIDDEVMKPLVRKIAQRFSVYIENDKSRDFFVRFLVKLQNAHDLAFDEYDKLSGNEMENFKRNISDVKYWLIEETTKL